jgi:hypothetical protein
LRREPTLQTAAALEDRQHAVFLIADAQHAAFPGACRDRQAERERAERDGRQERVRRRATRNAVFVFM